MAVTNQRRPILRAVVACGIVVCAALMGYAMQWEHLPKVLLQAGEPEAASTAVVRAGDTMEQCIVAIRSATGNVAPQVLAAHMEEPDDEWKAFPRHSGSIVRGCMANAVALQARNMYRSKEMNPRDIVIPKLRRTELEIILSAVRPQLQGLSDACNTIYDMDLQRAVATGAVRDLGFAPSEVVAGENHPAGVGTKLWSFSLAPVQAAGADMGVIANGRVAGIARRDLPASRQALELERFTGGEIATGIIAWFHSGGVLEHAEAEILRQLALR